MMRGPGFFLCAALFGCSASGDGDTGGTTLGDTGTSADTSSSTSDTGGASGDVGFTADVSTDTAPTTYPVRKIPGLVSITYYERSGGTAPTAYTFTVDGPEMTTYIPTLSDSAHDIKGVSTELYDVYYSNEKGEFELDGRYLTISGVFQYALPAGGGLNLAEIVLDYSGGVKEYGNYVASYVALGDNAVPASVSACIDGDLSTNTTMGNTIGTTDRLRITLGFKSSSGPPK
ncbi:MAG: hypothetical protein ACXWP4_16195 [Polyangiales bacterium]